MKLTPAYWHTLAQLLVGAVRANQLRESDPDAYARLLARVREVRRTGQSKREAGE